jgi:hypothetical protein
MMKYHLRLAHPYVVVGGADEKFSLLLTDCCCGNKLFVKCQSKKDFGKSVLRCGCAACASPYFTNHF